MNCTYALTSTLKSKEGYIPTNWLLPSGGAVVSTVLFIYFLWQPNNQGEPCDVSHRQTCILTVESLVTSLTKLYRNCVQSCDVTHKQSCIVTVESLVTSLTKLYRVYSLVTSLTNKAIVTVESLVTSPTKLYRNCVQSCDVTHKQSCIVTAERLVTSQTRLHRNRGEQGNVTHKRS